jgi:hypothetical protein
MGSRPFSARTLPPIEKPPVSMREQVFLRSRELYARDRQQVEADIEAWFAPIPSKKQLEHQEYLKEKRAEVEANGGEWVASDYPAPPEEEEEDASFKPWQKKKFPPRQNQGDFSQSRFSSPPHSSPSSSSYSYTPPSRPPFKKTSYEDGAPPSRENKENNYIPRPSPYIAPAPARIPAPSTLASVKNPITVSSELKDLLAQFEEGSHDSEEVRVVQVISPVPQRSTISLDQLKNNQLNNNNNNNNNKYSSSHEISSPQKRDYKKEERMKEKTASSTSVNALRDILAKAKNQSPLASKESVSYNPSTTQESSQIASSSHEQPKEIPEDVLRQILE